MSISYASASRDSPTKRGNVSSVHGHNDILQGSGGTSDAAKIGAIEAQKHYAADWKGRWCGPMPFDQFFKDFMQIQGPVDQPRRDLLDFSAMPIKNKNIFGGNEKAAALKEGERSADVGQWLVSGCWGATLT